MDNNKVIFIAIFSMLFLFSCKVREKIVEVEVPKVKHDTVMIYRDRTDSLLIRDSVWVNSGSDTIREYRYKYVDRIKTIHDSIYVGRTDTITTTIEVEVEKSLTAKEKVAMWIGKYLWWVILLCLVFVLWRMLRK